VLHSWVFLKIQPYRQRSLAKRRFEKLAPRFFGPYKVIRQIGSVAYELELPPDSRIHPVFHVSMLKPARGIVPPTALAPLPLTRDWVYDVQPHSVLDYRWVLEAGQPVLELLISWMHRPKEEATWESYDLFSSFQLSNLRTSRLLGTEVLLRLNQFRSTKGETKRPKFRPKWTC
jgi:hypothetical protein